VNWVVLVVPVVMHLTSYALYFELARWQEPTALVAAIPLQLLAGVFVFAQPWL
jgi:Cu/Ag efflux pump CusA